MIVDGFQKLTLLDFPNTVSCIVFTKGCNLRCPFCYNSPLVLNTKSDSNYSEEYILDYLNKRKNVLDGVVISGGEPTLQKDLKEFILKVKELGYKVKLDTNGTNPKVLKELLDLDLLDYVAMDIKNSFEKYKNTSGINRINLDNIKKSILLLRKSKIDYEFRTTIVKEFHTIEDIISILNTIGDSKYYIQNFQDNENVIKKGLHSFNKDELLEINNELLKKFTNFKIREL